MSQNNKQSIQERLTKQLNETRKHAAQQLQALADRSNSPRIYPPDKLLYSKDFKSSDFKAAVQPYWDPIALELQLGAYRDVLCLLGRLRRRKKLADRNTSYTRQILYGWKMLRFIFRSEADVHGLDATLDDSLGTEPTSADQGHWNWAISHSETPNHQTIHDYYVSATDSLKTSYEDTELPGFFKTFPGDMTWNHVLTLIAENFDLETSNYNSRLGLSTAIDFRLSVIESVLWEYEVLGYAPLFENLAFKEAKQPPEELLDFIEKGFILYIEDRKNDAHPPEIHSRDGLILKTIAALDLESEASGMRSRLTSYDLYNKQTKEGPPYKRDQFPLLLDMLKIWEYALKRWNRWEKIRRIIKDVDSLHF